MQIHLGDANIKLDNHLITCIITGAWKQRSIDWLLQRSTAAIVAEPHAHRAACRIMLSVTGADAAIEWLCL